MKQTPARRFFVSFRSMKMHACPCFGYPSMLRQSISTGRSLHWLLLLISLVAILLPKVHAAQFSAAGFTTESIASGLTLPTAVAFPSSNRTFIAQKNGVVRVVDNGTLLSTPLIILSDVNDYGDRGLIGIATDPDFSSNGYVYLAYTYENDPTHRTGAKTARVVRYTTDGYTAIERTERVLLGTVGGSQSAPACADHAPDADCIASDSITHTVGGLRFGPDGKLYVAIGDGADFIGIDLNAFRAQDLDNLSGKILRINTDGQAVSDNPFYTGNAYDIRSKVWAYGFRNPYRFNFHPTDGRLFGGDVGWSLREEVNYILPGNNYGWPCREGAGPTGGGYPDLSECAAINEVFTDPIHDYLHVGNSGAVTGGAFALSANYPAGFRGSYVLADFSFGTMQYLNLDSAGNVLAVNDFATEVGGPVEIVTGPDGMIYYISIYRGELLKIVYSGGDVAIPPVAQVDYVTSNTEPLTVTYDASGSSTPDGGALQYQWQFGDGVTASGVSPTHTYNSSGTYQVLLTVTAENGLSDSTSVTVTLNDTNGFDSEPFLVSLTSVQSAKYIGTPILFRALLGNAANRDPFSVLFEVFDSNQQSVGRVWFESVKIIEGQSIKYDFSWLPVGLGNYYIDVSFFRDGTSQRIQPVTERAITFQVVPRSRSDSGSGVVGALDMLAGVIALVVVLRRRGILSQ